jgi:hypothetical protein
MRRVLPVLLPLFLIAGCEGGDAPPSGPTPQIRIGFPRGGIADTIAVNAIERLPLRTADLIAPDGKITPAGNIEAAASPRFATGQQSVGNPWQRALAASSPLATMTNAQAGAVFQEREQLLATVSSAEIALPDPVVYRRDWGHYRIRLTFGTPPGEVETRELAAPEPPPQ